ncbi:MAG: FAD-binding oxidoreductase [Chloroflexota bacterium]
MRRTSDVVIAGAGIAGVATAWQLATRLGTTSTVLVDPRPPLSLTSDRPGANYRNWWPQPSMVALADRSIALTDDLLASGAMFAMNRRGYLYVTADLGTAASLPSVVDRHVAAGVAPDDVELLDANDIASRYPHLASNLQAAIHARHAGSLDTVGLGRALLAVAKSGGVKVIQGEVVATAVVRNRVLGVTVSTPGGTLEIATERFVNAAGPFAREVARRLGSDLALETVLRQKVLIRDRRGIVPRDAPFTIGLDRTGDLPGGVHIKPDGGPASDSIKLGWAWDQTPSEPVADPPCPPEFPAQVLARAATLVPGLAASIAQPPVIVEHDGGFYARSADGLPMIGPHGVDGAYLIGGLAGFGSMMACSAGELTAAWVLDATLPRLAGSFDPRRFGEPGRPVERAIGVPPAGEL